MLHFQLPAASPPRTLLLLGAHCDDIEIGCAATVRRLVQQNPRMRDVWVTLSSDPEREAETRAAAARLVADADRAEVFIERFRGSYFPYEGAALKEYVDALKRFSPDLVLTHTRDDRHQDHRVVHDLTWNSFRDHQILEYEIPKFDGDLGQPNVYVPITRAELAAKCEMLIECFPSQRTRAWFTPDTFEALARLRGIECNAPEGFAEAFYGRKVYLDFSRPPQRE